MFISKQCIPVCNTSINIITIKVVRRTDNNKTVIFSSSKHITIVYSHYYRHTKLFRCACCMYVANSVLRVGFYVSPLGRTRLELLVNNRYQHKLGETKRFRSEHTNEQIQYTSTICAEHIQKVLRIYQPLTFPCFPVVWCLFLVSNGMHYVCFQAFPYTNQVDDFV